MNKRNIGKTGENMACDILEEKGYRIIERNYRYERGEIDVICAKDDCINFVEVKTRLSNKYGAPCEAVNKDKQMRIRETATHYLKNRDCNVYYPFIKFSVMEIIVNFIESAF